MRRLTACLVICFAAGCSTPGVAPGQPEDAGALEDGGAIDAGQPALDGSAAADAGDVDAGDLPDGGSELDGGQPSDGGVADGGIDAGPIVGCGNGTIEVEEDCDLGLQNGMGQGCSANCHYDCQADADCSDGNSCNGSESCVAATVSGQPVFACQPGELAAPCSPCATGLCNSTGTCQASNCGDGCTDPSLGEACDFGADGNGAGSGCEASCAFSCLLGSDTCEDANVCNGVATCATIAGANGGVGQACVSGTAPMEGFVCGPFAVCLGESCVAAVCGNGVTELGESCDLGEAINGTGVGCNSNCQLDCSQNSDCTDANVCNGAEFCVSATEQGQSVKRCEHGAAANRCTTCPAGLCDGSGLCAASSCGDGCTDGTRGEDCDFGAGSNLVGSGCEPGCAFSCVLGGTGCDDGNPCNGVESCAATVGPNGVGGQACQGGTPPMDGATCGSHLICQGGGCVPAPVECGNAFVEAGEACDLGADNGTGKGCDENCQLDCGTDADCLDTNVCNGAESCVAATEQGQNVKRCQAGSAADRCTACATGVCNGSGLCAASTCGDGCVDPNTEQCDFGSPNNVNSSGCESDCSFSCALGGAGCDDGNFCNGAESCVANTGANGTGGQACISGTNEANGTSCGTDLACYNGSCLSDAVVCGNGLLEIGEDCDLGTAVNGTGQGCSVSCHFDCATDAECLDADVCNGSEVCVVSTASGQTVKSCQPNQVAAACTPCASGFCNGSGQCAASSCGDHCVDAAAGEHCDDGNHFNLDGCDSACKYEVVTRMTTLAIQSTAAPSFCAPSTNRFGTRSLTTTAINQLNPILQTDVDNGGVNILTQLLGLEDLTGATDPNGLSFGLITGGKDPARGPWMGTSPIDWWFLADPTTVTNGLPTGLMTTTLSNHALRAGPNDVNLVLSLGGSPAILRMRNAQVAATVDTSPAPNVPAPPPDQLASGLTVFQSITASATNQGLCGNITVESLAQIPIPEALTTGTGACSSCTGSKVYKYCGADTAVGPGCNSLLDAMVGGCKANPVGLCFLAVGVINAAQPDVAATSGGGITTLTLGADNKVSAAQTSGNNDAYSAYFKFNANRAHLTGQKCTQTSDCQTGLSCVSELCQ